MNSLWVVLTLMATYLRLRSARRSRLTVSVVSFQFAPQSPHPASSIKITTKFGGRVDPVVDPRIRPQTKSPFIAATKQRRATAAREVWDAIMSLEREQAK
jgi:hypothetical protein